MRLLILHDNAIPHKHQKVQEFFRPCRWDNLKHPPYSPDLNTSNYNGITLIKWPNKGNRFANEDELKTAYDKVIEERNLKYGATGI